MNPSACLSPSILQLLGHGRNRELLKQLTLPERVCFYVLVTLLISRWQQRMAKKGEKELE